MSREALDRYNAAIERARAVLPGESPLPGGMSAEGESVQRELVSAWLDLDEEMSQICDDETCRSGGLG